jgi:hypothetical protein
LIAATLLFAAPYSSVVFAAPPAPPEASAEAPAPAPAQPAHKPQSEYNPAGTDEIITGPFSEYGEFDNNEDEESDERFFQFGRFFGLGLGFGMTTASGNAGLLYQGGFPTLELKLDYWFNFFFALQVNVQNSKHNYDRPEHGPTDVNLFRTLFQLKYYFDTNNLAAPVTFVSPHLIAGGGYYSRTDNIGAGAGTGSSQIVSYSAFGFNGGGGLELTITPKRTYIQFEGLVHFAQFADNLSHEFADSGVPDRTGPWLTGMVSVMFTW